MNLIILHGPPAAGKFTIATELSRITKYKVIHIHSFYDPLADIFGEEGENYLKVIDILEKHFLEIFKEASKQKINGLIFTYTEIVRNNFRFLKKISSVLQKYGGRLFLVQLTCSEEELSKRVVNPSRKKHWKTQTKKDLRWMLENKDYRTTFPNKKTLKIDNTNLSPKKVAQQIKTYFKLK